MPTVKYFLVDSAVFRITTETGGFFKERSGCGKDIEKNTCKRGPFIVIIIEESNPPVGKIIPFSALSWLKPGKVMILRSSEIVAAYILQIRQTQWFILNSTRLSRLFISHRII
jgi:hypothetical protein